MGARDLYNVLVSVAVLGAQVGLVVLAGALAYDIRLEAIRDYGLVIHEFDPWFNFRATEYLAEHGWSAFFHWYDYMSWYPLGRPVGSTIYPGMQITAVTIWNSLPYFGINMSLNDVCCYMPAWFGVLATMFLALLTWECSGSRSAATAAALIMAIIPAHIMRSVGGGYDNESVAVTAMCLTFFCWCRSLRSEEYAVRWGVLTGLAYINMVAAWGGYIFVVNMIGLHALGLIVLGRYSKKLHVAYSLFFVIGTLGAIQIPVVGLSPLKSLEQLGPCGVFLLLQAIAYCESQRTPNMSWKKVLGIYVYTFLMAGLALLAVVSLLWPTGYFGPLSSRIRGLFVKHTRTGNPLVDSVAEHQPASAQAYDQYLNNVKYLAPIGWFFSLLRFSDASLFLAGYGATAFYFSTRMARLIILLGPMASACGGIAIGYMLDLALMQFFMLPPVEDSEDEGKEKTEEPQGVVAPEGVSTDTADSTTTRKRKNKKGGKTESSSSKPAPPKPVNPIAALKKTWAGFMSTVQKIHRNPVVRVICILMAIFVIVAICYPPKPRHKIAKYLGVSKQIAKMAPKKISLFGRRLSGYPMEFYDYARQMAKAMSNPSLMFKGRLQNGEEIIVDDYREAYWWLRDNTPPDARVMAWWDYGYQITGIGNRTTIADGNTWNHEHIATLGRSLTSTEKEAHAIIRHWADYVLIWTGGGGDDLAKSPHMARIAASVYPDHCPGDPTCRMFGFDQSGNPTPMMRDSLLYKLSGHGVRTSVSAKRFKDVYKSKYGKVRIFKVQSTSKKSKAWVADPTNRACDAEGSWFCRGQYPPAIRHFLDKKWKKKDFAQVEDWNKKRDRDADKHYEEYMKNMGGR